MSGHVAVAVVGRAREAEILAASAACALAAGSSLRAAILLRAGDGRPRRLAPPTPGAVRLRERLTAGGLEALASGRIVWCVASSERDVSRACVGAPAVLAFCGPRERWTESLLDQAGLVLVAGGANDAVAELALEELRERAIPAVSSPAPEGAASMLGKSGIWPDPSLRELIERHSVRS